MSDDEADIREEIEFWRELIEHWWINHSGCVPETAWEALAEAERSYLNMMGVSRFRRSRY